MDDLRNAFLIVGIVVVCVVLIFLRRRRQKRLDRMVFKPPVTCRELRREHPADANCQLASITIGFGMWGRENTVEVEVEIDQLKFERLGEAYTLVLGQVGVLLQAIRQKGLGRLWKEGQEQAFWHTIESQVGATIAQHEASLAQFAAAKMEERNA